MGAVHIMVEVVFAEFQNNAGKAKTPVHRPHAKSRWRIMNNSSRQQQTFSSSKSSTTNNPSHPSATLVVIIVKPRRHHAWKRHPNQWTSRHVQILRPVTSISSLTNAFQQALMLAFLPRVMYRQPIGPQRVVC